MTGRPSPPRTLTASVVFVDLVGSTELRARLGEDRADAHARSLETQISVVVGEHNGRVVKGLGDGALAIFESTVDAVGAAVALQQQAELSGRHDSTEAVRLRIGMSAGDVSFDRGDVLGTPVVEASRLCAAAQPSQVLVADLVRSLSRGRGSFVFESVGDLSLRGLPEPVSACQVMWDPIPEEAEVSAGQLPFPGLLSSRAGISYVGREAIIESLTTRLNSVLAGDACLSALLVSGEPGIGKTRTASELARRAHAEGAVVLYGCCDEDLGVPFQPFVEALDFYSTHHPAPELGRLPGELVRLCPEMRARVAGLPAAVVSDPRTEEYRLFEAVTSWLIDASQESGMLVVLDDLHWATHSTLLLLAHLLKAAAAARPARLVVIGTYRDTELDRAHPLTSVLADLRRVEGTERVDLRGLNLDESVALVETVAGHELDDNGLQLAEAAFAETEGNPLFMGEVLRHFVETAAVSLVDGRWHVTDPGQVEVPEGVRDVIGRRLSRLSEPANRVLAVAAVIGREFDLDLLSQVSDVGDEVLLDALDEASRARLVDETGPDRYRFFHAMVKETLYSELTSARRRRLHQMVLEVLEKLRPHDAVALAFHAVEAGPVGGDTTIAVGHLLDAAGQASDSRDLPGAESYYLQAIEMIDTGHPDPQRRLEATCGLGEAQRDQSNPAFRQTLLEATHAALALGRLDLAARAAIANFRGTTSAVNEVDRERIEALGLTLDAFERERSSDVAVLAATLVAEINYDPDASMEYRLELTDLSIDIARELGDPRIITEVIIRTARMHLLPERAAAGVSLVTEALRLADQVGDPTIRAISRVFAHVSYSIMGDLERAERCIAEGVGIAQADCPPFVLALCRANAVQYLAYHGQLAEAVATNDELLGFYQQIGVPDGEQWWGATAMTIALLQGTAGDFADPAGEFADRYPTASAWRCTHALALAEGGRLDESRDVIERHALNRPERFLVDEFIASSWGYLGLLALRLDDPRLGAAAEALLGPYERLWVCVQIYNWGPITGMLAAAVAAQGRFDEADALFSRTDDLLAQRGLTLHRNLLALDRATALSRSDSPTHRELARDLAAAGADQSRQFGLDRLGQRFDNLLGSIPGP